MRHHRILCASLFIIAMIFAIPHVQSQNNRPDPLRVYRQIVLFNKLPLSQNNLWRIRWMEIWETHHDAAGQEEWVVTDYTALKNGIVSSCYHTISTGTGISIIEMPQELIPVNSSEALWAQLENVGTQAVIEKMESLDCRSNEYNTINGYDAQHCSIENTDAAGIFTLGENAASIGNLWVSRGGFPVRYQYQAEGQSVRVTQQYEAFSIDESQLPDFAPRQQVGLYCFEDGFPRPENTISLVEGNLVYAAFESEQTVDELKRFFDDALQPAWTFNSGTNTLIQYDRQLPNNNSCRMSLEFLDTGTTTQFKVEVLPTSLQGVPIPEGFESLVQAGAPLNDVVEENPVAVLDAFLEEQSVSGWVERSELTIRSEDAAFAVIKNGDQQRYIVLERKSNGMVEKVTGDLPGLCGPTFPIPAN